MKDAYTVCALYQFAHIKEPRALRVELLDELTSRGIRGTIIVAPEGVNGTISGSAEAIDEFVQYMRADERFRDLKPKLSRAKTQPFHRTKVKLKQEIVTMGIPNVDPAMSTGTHVPPAKWNQLISDPDVLLIDARNEYEIEVGSFEGAVNPHTESFRDFPAYAEAHLDPARHRKVAMFCTGGIRCEKSTAYLKSKGFDEVYQLEGGVLAYLEQVPEAESLWRGECFVFDGRVTVNHQLEPGSYDQCHACRMPLSADDKRLPSYVPGVSCKHCVDARSDTQRLSSMEREMQVRLADARGEAHLGGDAKASQERRKQEKRVTYEASRASSLNKRGSSRKT